jgi:uncharacterized protein DUF3606
MADNKKKTGKQDRSRISMSEPYEVQYWKKKFGVTGQGLAGAIRAIGSNNAEKVGAYLKAKHK